MTVDVEDYFQVSAFEKIIARSSWDTLPCRVEQNTDRILQLFADHRVCGTFFMLGWVAERYPALVQRIVSAGHELASHGFSHVRVTAQDRESFREDVSRTRKLLEDLSGTPVVGYRAASYSIGRDNLWAHCILAEAGYHYSSSIYPIHHDLYGMPEAPRFAFRSPEASLLEIPVSTVEVFGYKFPCGGGGYFRLLPYGLFHWALRRVNHCDSQPCIFYFHPWEIDPDQPRQQGIGMKTRFRHYLNLQHMEQRLLRLLSDFHWDRMDRVFASKI
jgi:polysaccharide deacetylase family protein (PEP-CTERM system associated)